MAYTLQAVITKSGGFPKELPLSLQIVCLGAGVDMIPLTEEVLESFEIPALPLTDEGEIVLPETLASFCSMLSEHGPIAYIEAEYFGGAGTQANCLFVSGALTTEPLVADNAINRALKFLGVNSEEVCDEFDAVGLGQHRDTDSWLT